MSLSSLHLDAFHAVARTLNFSRAAKDLHITQSALTQRIQNLEDELGLTLFVRSPRGVVPTPSGERLLRYCQARASMEDELVQELTGKESDDSGLGGTLRIAGYSSILRSVIVPALAPMLRENPRIQLNFMDLELRQLEDALMHGESDYVVVDKDLRRGDVESVLLGEEENVLVTSREHDPPEDLYLDHDPDDRTTFDFLAHQGGRPPEIRRSFFDDIHGIIDGAALGLGRAVIPKHLARADERLKIVKTMRPLKTPVYLQYFKQPFYTRLHEQVVADLRRQASKFL